ncbi:hypothetical protein ZIOFF_010821 [Zingiber officinale]|uniref:non-specific serine/threonine protein kinase n=1 Tax=Zingiber officinale TaxID=94328 RepID=A0A8J5I200_ZINOF|nr:hypothetical protein ZIOFF_010821 [Zingiber officinale]
MDLSSAPNLCDPIGKQWEIEYQRGTAGMLIGRRLRAGNARDVDELSPSLEEHARTPGRPGIPLRRSIQYSAMSQMEKINSAKEIMKHECKLTDQLCFESAQLCQADWQIGSALGRLSSTKKKWSFTSLDFDPTKHTVLTFFAPENFKMEEQLLSSNLQQHLIKAQFLTEIATISALQHRNLVKLYGCCVGEDKRILLYEYSENKTRGLAYLHQESRVRIVHRNVTASNILLEADLHPKISDFGLAKLYDDKMTHINTRVVGTM